MVDPQTLGSRWKSSTMITQKLSYNIVLHNNCAEMLFIQVIISLFNHIDYQVVIQSASYWLICALYEWFKLSREDKFR